MNEKKESKINKRLSLLDQGKWKRYKRKKRRKKK